MSPELQDSKSLSLLLTVGYAVIMPKVAMLTEPKKCKKYLGCVKVHVAVKVYSMKATTFLLGDSEIFILGGEYRL